MPFDLFMTSFFSTNIAIYEEFGYEHYWSLTQDTETKYISVYNPTRQKVFFTVETLSKRFKPHGCSPDHWLNIYLFRDDDLLNEDRLGFIGSLMYHDSIGDVHYREPIDAG